jgi:hypothetical protein
MRWLLKVRAVAHMALACSCWGVRPVSAQAPALTRGPSLLRAAGAIIAVNGLAWTYNRYVQRWDWARVGPDTWWANLRSGFQWDDDALTDNQLAHPLHGSFYYNAARGAGYSFWGSAPFVALGSLTWEFLAENVRPSPNDVINTTLGGIALGEVTSRLARLLATTTAGERTPLPSRLGAVVLDPIGRLQGWRGSEARGSARNDQESLLAPWLAVGLQRGLPDGPDGPKRYHFLQLGVRQGDVFGVGYGEPFDAFELDVELMQQGTWQLRRLQVSGLLLRSAVHRAASGELAWGLFQHYEFLAQPMVLGGQRLSGAMLYRRPLGRQTDLRIGLHLEAILLGEIASEENNLRRRDYDYAPGAGARFDAAFRRAGRDFLSLQCRGDWLHSVYGAAARHRVLTTRLGAALPLSSLVALGGETAFTWRRSTYPDGVIRRHMGEVRAYVAWPAF